MRKPVSFTYKGKSYSGYIITSTDCQPHYYWLFFKDLALIRKFGDSIGFKQKGNDLVPTQRHSDDLDFIESIKLLIQSYLSNQ